MYPTASERERYRCNRGWPTQKATVPDLDHRGCPDSVLFVLANNLGLSFCPLVWFTRLLVSLLVRVQDETLAVRGLYSSDRVAVKRDFPALSTTVWRVRLRKPHNHS